MTDPYNPAFGVVPVTVGSVRNRFVNNGSKSTKLKCKECGQTGYPPRPEGIQGTERQIIFLPKEWWMVKHLEGHMHKCKKCITSFRTSSGLVHHIAKRHGGKG